MPGIYSSVSFSVPKFWESNSDSVFFLDKRVSENKNFSIQVEAPWTGYSNSISIIDFMFCASWKDDHAGVELAFGLLGFQVMLNFYDIRHWNDDADRYYLPGEEQELWNNKK